MRPKTKASLFRLALNLIALGLVWWFHIDTWKSVIIWIAGLGTFYYCAAREAEITTEEKFADVKAYLKKEGYI